MLCVFFFNLGLVETKSSERTVKNSIVPLSLRPADSTSVFDLAQSSAMRQCGALFRVYVFLNTRARAYRVLRAYGGAKEGESQTDN